MNKIVGDVRVMSLDEPNFGAHHVFAIIEKDAETIKEDTSAVGFLSFQKGPVREVGLNGITHEALLEVIIDRLNGFQGTEFKCPDNEQAIYGCTVALEALNRRTKDRESRGVEGLSVV